MCLTKQKIMNNIDYTKQPNVCMGQDSDAGDTANSKLMLIGISRNSAIDNQSRLGITVTIHVCIDTPPPPSEWNNCVRTVP